jgi:transcriptional regulator with XRE-family HTH domain
MDLFAKRLKERGRQLELSDAEVARRAGLSERRYGHYVRGIREPDFATMLRICRVLDVTPDALLLPRERTAPLAHDRWLSRLLVAGRKLQTEDLKLAVKQLEVLLDHRSG